MALTSTSTYADAVAQYRDNLSYEGDVAKARAFLEACRWLLLDRATRSSKSDGSSIDHESIRAEMDRVNRYLDTFDATSRPRASFVQGRARQVL